MITTVDALHLSEGRLLVAFLGEANKAVSAGLSVTASVMILADLQEGCG